jgi:hypothetical protein
VLGNELPGLQTEREASAFPAGSEGRSSRDSLLPLQGIKSGQSSSNVSHQSVGCAIGHRESMVMRLVVTG